MKQTCSKEMTELNRAYKETEYIYSQYAASCGVSTTTLCLLYSLYTEEMACTQTQLVADWGIPMQTINSCLKNLEKDGLLRLEYRAGNKKSKYISLTAEGEAVCDRIVGPMVQAENAAFAELAAEEQNLLLRTLRKHNGLLRAKMLHTGERN